MRYFRIFEESKTEHAQRARNELRRVYSMRKIITDNLPQNFVNNVFNTTLDGYILIIGGICVVFMILIFLMLIYLCCRRSSKSSGKMNCSAFNQDLIYGNGNPTSTLGLNYPKNGKINGVTVSNTLQRTSTLAHQRYYQKYQTLL